MRAFKKSHRFLFLALFLSFVVSGIAQAQEKFSDCDEALSASERDARVAVAVQLMLGDEIAHQLPVLKMKGYGHVVEIARHNQMRLLLHVSQGNVFNRVDLIIAQQLTESAATAIKNLPTTYHYHNSLDEEGEKALEELPVKPRGLKIMEKLYVQGLYGTGPEFVKLPHSIGDIVSTAEKAAKNGLSVSAGDRVYLNQGRLERQFDGSIRDLDLNHFWDLEGVGQVGAFSLHLAVSKNVNQSRLTDILRLAIKVFEK